MNGKGSKPRPTDLKRYGANYDEIFRKKLNYQPNTEMKRIGNKSNASRQGRREGEA